MSETTEKAIICTVCPIGCCILIKASEHEALEIAGNQCDRGLEYAREECLHPVRVLTTTVFVAGSSSHRLVACRSSKPIPKELLLFCMEKIKTLSVEAPVERYDILIPNILDTGANIIATSTVR